MNKDGLREYILSHGCYSREKNLLIYKKWFEDGPRYLFRALDKKYRVTKKVLCDVGCAYGMNLLYCAQGSYGIEIEAEKVSFARSLGLSVYQRDVVNDILTDLPKVDVAWCSAVLEHVSSPHHFLTRLHFLLDSEGMLIVYVPTIPIFRGLEYLPGLGQYISGYKRDGHINAFVPSTLKYICEKAGFRTIEISPFYPGALGVFNHFPLVNRLTGRCIYVGKRADH
jgi:SAM-dependent methyltransferase